MKPVNNRSSLFLLFRGVFEHNFQSNLKKLLFYTYTCQILPFSLQILMSVAHTAVIQKHCVRIRLAVTSVAVDMDILVMV